MKAIGIIILGLFLSSNAYAAEPIVIRKDADSITFKHKRLGFFKRGSYAKRHCAQYTKFAYLFHGDTSKSKGEVIYYCSAETLSISPSSGKTRRWSNYQDRKSEVYKKIAKEEAKEEKEAKKFEKLEGYKATCEAFGFKPGTERFADCALKLFVEDNKKAPVVQSSGGTMTIHDPAREWREQRKVIDAWNKAVSRPCGSSGIC